MGVCGLGSYSSYDCRSADATVSASPPNPNPRNFIIERSCSVGSFVVVMIRYPDCTNYEGRKILVFQNISEYRIKLMNTIDPHFSKDNPKESPVARFVPTEEGWGMAIGFAMSMTP